MITTVGQVAIIVASLSIVNAAVAQNCTDGVPDLVKLVGAGDDDLEPSGLVWAADLGMAIGVDDDRSGYEIFAFHPNSAEGGRIEPTRVLTPSQSDSFQLVDLEGLTRTNDGVFFAFTSQSIAGSGESAVNRFQAVRFRIDNTDDRLAAVDIERISARQPNLRAWLIRDSGRSWPDNIDIKRTYDYEGLNVEGLASTPNGTLLVGFRGPTVAHFKTLVAEIAAPREEAAPQLLRWFEVDLSDLPPASASKGPQASRVRGIRAIERIPEDESAYVVVVGHVGLQHDRLRVGIWDANSNRYADRCELPEGFVAEGAAVTSATPTELNLLLVSDREGYVMPLTIKR